MNVDCVTVALHTDNLNVDCDGGSTHMQLDKLTVTEVLHTLCDTDNLNVDCDSGSTHRQPEC